MRRCPESVCASEGWLELHDRAVYGHRRVEGAFRPHGYKSRDNIVLASSLGQTIDELCLAASVVALEIFETPQPVCELTPKVIVIEGVENM